MSTTLANPPIDVRNGVYEWFFVMPQDVNTGPTNRQLHPQPVHAYINHPGHGLIPIVDLRPGPSGPVD